MTEISIFHHSLKGLFRAVCLGSHMFTKSILNDIRDRIPITTLIGERVSLKKAGRNFKGLCPFHNEKSPSFNVNDEKGIFHCFGCGEGGDIFQFVMKFDGIGFAEAVKYLADRTGVELPRDTNPALKAAEDESAKKKRYLLRINEVARDYFASRLLDERAGAKARGYLQQRGLSEEFWTQLFLGYADNAWDSLVGHLSEKGAPLELAAELGLIKKRDGGGYYDFFRDRLIFPIVSPRGETLAFSGRDISEGGEAAKYLNSPDSAIYHKSNCVLGLNVAQTAIRNENLVILVEGNMDMASLHQAGIANVVAPLGTALTAGHLKLLKRYTRNMMVVFDGDEAGSRAAVRSLEVFIEEGLSPRVVPLPDGEDPDTLIKKDGADGFRKRIAAAPSLFEYVVDRTIAETGADAAGKVQAMAKIIPILKGIADPAEQGIYTRHLARRLDADEGSIRKSMAKTGVRTKMPGALTGKEMAEEKIKHPLSPPAKVSAEGMLIEILLRRPESAASIFGEISPESFEDAWCRTVAGMLHEQWKLSGAVDISAIIDGISDSELAAQLRQISLDADRWNEDEVADLTDDCLSRITERPALARMERINDDIRIAEMSGDEKKLMELLVEKRTLAEELRGR